MLGAMSIVAALHRRDRAHGEGQYIDASMVQASLMLMYPNASSFLTSGVEPQRVGNRGYTGSPTADTYRCADGWLATAANTPAQFRKLCGGARAGRLCDDGAALDLRCVQRARRRLRRGARPGRTCSSGSTTRSPTRSAADDGERLNAVGVPAARVRKLGEFLDEAQGQGGHRPDAAAHADQAAGQAEVRTPGLGFRISFRRHGRRRSAPVARRRHPALLSELGRADAIAALCDAGAVKSRLPVTLAR